MWLLIIQINAKERIIVNNKSRRKCLTFLKSHCLFDITLFLSQKSVPGVIFSFFVIEVSSIFYNFIKL